MNPSVEALAHEFSEALRSVLSPREMKTVIRRNRKQHCPNICHSHDFCDTNIVLHQVFLRHGMDAADEGGLDRWGDLWDATWNLAKFNEFRIDQKPL